MQIQVKLPTRKYTIQIWLAILNEEKMEQNTMKFRTLLTFFILITPALCLAAMYKYKDESGNWVYSQHPPASGEYEALKAKKEPRSSRLNKEERVEKVNKARDSVTGKPADKAEKDSVAKETAKNKDKRADACEKSKKGLESLQIYRRFKDKDGNVTTMDDKERQKRISNAKENIKQFCN